MHAIEFVNVSKQYPGTEKPAVSNLSLQVEAGTLTGILGPSGCGKTTTLRMLAGFERPDQGKILLAGRAVNGPGVFLPPERRGVGMVFQDYALFPHLTVADNVAFGLRGLDNEQRVAELLELVNIRGYAGRYPHELSGGQQQRVALARALAPRPAVVLMDEPFSSLDSNLRQQMRSELRRILRQAEATAILVTHDQKDALAISDQIVVMSDGQIQQHGTPREVYEFPRNTFVATFVGQSNLLRGQPSANTAGLITTMGDLPFPSEGFCRGSDEVVVSIRPHGFRVDASGPIKGRIRQLAYTGQFLDAYIDVVDETGLVQKLLVQLPASASLQEGEELRLAVLPDSITLLSA